MSSSSVREIPLEEIFRNPNQPRTIFDQTGLDELAANILRVGGIIQPITVAPRDGRFMIVAGERRFRASSIAGMKTVRCIVNETLTDEQIQELALVENELRKDLTALEQARAYQSFLDRGYTVEHLARVLGMKQPHRITDRTALLKLDPQFQDALSRGILNPSQASEMAGLSVPGQYKLWRSIQDGRCETYAKLRRMAAAIRDAENQTELFPNLRLGDRERDALSRVDRFISDSGRLIDSITDDDLSVLEEVLKSDANVCVQRLDLLSNVCRRVRNALLANLAKQEVLAA